jgi:shikimate dehydrogenase
VTPEALAAFGCVVDFVYTDTDTALIRAARARSVPVVDGLELLVRQGALSFERFTGRRAPLDAMRAAVRVGAAPVSSGQ